MKAEDIYRRSHSFIEPGEQTNRRYDWHGDDKNIKVFGIKGNGLQFNGVSPAVSEVLRGGGYTTEESSVITRKEVKPLLDDYCYLSFILVGIPSSRKHKTIY